MDGFPLSELSWVVDVGEALAVLCPRWCCWQQDLMEFSWECVREERMSQGLRVPIFPHPRVIFSYPRVIPAQSSVSGAEG